jgi:hypothetical protein
VNAFHKLASVIETVNKLKGEIQQARLLKNFTERRSIIENCEKNLERGFGNQNGEQILCKGAMQ